MDNHDTTSSASSSSNAKTDRRGTLSTQVIAACGASVVSAFVVNPLDVVKTRMQASAATGSPATPTYTSCHFQFRPCWLPVRCLGSAALQKQWIRPECHCESHRPTSSAALSMECMASSKPSMLGTWRSIVNKEGVAVLWRGLDSTVLMALPMIALYMPLYDHLLSHFSTMVPSTYAPAIAGVTARVVSVTCAAPLEYARTRQQASMSRTALGRQQHLNVFQVLQALSSPNSSSSASTSSSSRFSQSTLRGSASSASTSFISSSTPPARQLLQTLPRLWTGCSATLARDIPFSALYWSLLEPLRASLLSSSALSSSATSPPSSLPSPEPSRAHILTANLLSGAVAGSISATLTTPFDVIKTRLQLRDPLLPGPSAGPLQTLREVYRSSGWRGLYVGAGPRAAKAAPSCAIVIGSYELLKSYM